MIFGDFNLKTPFQMNLNDSYERKFVISNLGVRVIYKTKSVLYSDADDGSISSSFMPVNLF